MQELDLSFLKNYSQSHAQVVQQSFLSLSISLLEKSGAANELILSGLEDTLSSFKFGQMSVINIEDPCFHKDIGILSDVLISLQIDTQISVDKRKRLFKLLAHSFRASASLGVLYKVLTACLLYTSDAADE